VSDGNFENQVFEMFSAMFALVKEITGEKEMTMFEFLHILNQSYFLFQKEGNIIPLEVKAEENLKAKSLRLFVDKFKPSTAIRTSMSPYRKQEWMENVPLWAVKGI
jgi:hypothetical protein